MREVPYEMMSREMRKAEYVKRYCWRKEDAALLNDETVTH